MLRVNTHRKVLTLNRTVKRAVMVIADLIALVLALWSAYALRFADPWPERFIPEAWPLFITVPFFGVAVFVRLGLYRAIIRYMSVKAIYAVAKGVALTALSIYALSYIFVVDPFPRSIPINFALVALVYVGGSRLFVRSYHHWLLRRFLVRKPVMIYGAGGAGVQLFHAIQSSAEFEPICFIDDDKSVQRSIVAGLPVLAPEALEEGIKEYGVEDIFLALPSVDPQRRRAILETLAQFEIHVKTVPAMHEILSGTAVDKLREVDVEDLLGRLKVEPDANLLSANVTGKVVLVSGAGGSIGGEICRQLIKLQPTTLILYELSEPALYQIEQELTVSDVEVVPILGSILDVERMSQVLRHYSVNTVYHAAAYKHVPLVEHNVVQGVQNNALGTLAMANAAVAEKVERFILVSTDKAVRPTNVMGATKRLAELILQDKSTTQQDTTFGMVRFGNVLGSSGSVVPKFKRQIEQGGPVTVTHPEITRYFMTIPEAASLVIQAGAMAEGGDVFVLDMGESVKIVDLAETMVRLSGLSVRSVDTPDGDIEIQFCGLRPGEKLFEELLIGDNVSGTLHPKIMRAEESSLAHGTLANLLDRIEQAVAEGDSNRLRDLLREAIDEYQPSGSNVDYLGASASGDFNLPVH